jgi:hypothetical protein
MNINISSSLAAAVLCGGALLGSAFAGQEISKNPIDKNPPVEAPYEAGRGLITLQGPSGLFINPTSATLPQNLFTAQYCIFLPNTEGEVIGHGLMASFGVTDWLEVGGIANLVDLDKPVNREFIVGGPLVRLRLMKDEGWMPQLSIGAYGKYGTVTLQQTTVFLAAYKRLPLDEEGFFKSLGFHAGIRTSWFADDVRESNSIDGYGGLELQLPARFYLVGEIGTRSNDRPGQFQRTPYSFGFQWRPKGVNLSMAMIQPGNTQELSLYIGVGSGFQF